VKITSERIAELRRFAQIERTAVMELRGREGEDPLTTLVDLPSVDVLVVRELCHEILEERGLLAEFSLARLAGRGSGDDAAEHQHNADQLEFEVLREISNDIPELTVAAWEAAGKLGR
jgi:hypothetical protein